MSADNREQILKELERTKSSWQEKKSFFEDKLVITDSAGKEFELKKEIQKCDEEIKRKIKEIEFLKKEIELENNQPISQKSEGQEKAINAESPQHINSGYSFKKRKYILGAAAIALILSLGIILDVILPVKALQQWELKAFDKLMQVRRPEQKDSRLLIIKVTEENLQKYGYPIPNETLAKLIEKLERYQPKVIGVNILREQRVENNNKLIYICNHPVKDNPNSPGNPAPQGVFQEHVGFSDVIEDSDEVIRRHLLFMNPESSLCQTPFSFSFLLAAYYLEAQGIYPKETPEKYTKFNQTILKKLTADNAGVYENEDVRGYQLLLNYRLVKEYKNTEKDLQISPISETWTLDSVLNNKVSLDYVRDKIIIIGSTSDISGGGYFSTPYSEGQYKKIPAVELQAQMVSQIISAVLDKRPLLSFLPKWGEVLWIWSWILIGALIAWIFYGKWSWFLLSDSIAIVILVGFCWGLLSLGYWIPSVRSVLALIIASGGTILFLYKFG